MTIPAGTRLGAYEILQPIGAGGMGDVFKATDTRLGRLVAIKVLRADQLSDSNRRRRFEQEAKAASALNHPNIVTIYDIGSDNDADFIVMEFIMGRSLDHVIPREGMRLSEALDHAIPVADALARAHAAGIVHRDLKPANIMVADDGTIKLLDFGLAKLVESVPVGDLPTEAANAYLTEDGAILGTVSYMSPEQAEAKPVDARSDIFSLVLELQPKVLVLRNGETFRLIVDGFDEPLICKKLNSSATQSNSPSADKAIPTVQPIQRSTSGCSTLIEAQIDGTFNGWTGETVFKLTNGQVWQQSSYSYTYHYAYQPKVMI